MNLRDSLLAAADEAPLGPSTVDVDRIVTRGRRTAVAWRAGGATVLVSALAVPVLIGGPGHAPGRSTTAGPPATRPADRAGAAGTAPLRLTAADLTAAMPAPGTGDVSAWRLAVGELPRGAGLLEVRITQGAAAGNPCELAPGATPGRDGAATADDKCTKIEKDGHSVWIRRWGYSPKERPWTTPDTVVVELFLTYHGRQIDLILANTELPIPGQAAPATPGRVGPRFEISDAELGTFAFDLLAPNR